MLPYLLVKDFLNVTKHTQLYFKIERHSTKLGALFQPLIAEPAQNAVHL